MLTHDQLKELLDYDLESGIFTWLKARSNRISVGGKAGYLAKNGYTQIRIDGKLYYAHRLAWLFVNKAWPIEQIDHIDRDKTNNRINNLRASSVSENHANIPKKSNNTSGYKGVYWQKVSKKWCATIRYQNKERYLGSYDDILQAALAYNTNATKYFGEFACLNEIN